jgi:CRISPR-associated protein Cas2
MKPRIWLVSYDIADNRRRAGIAKLLLEHGDRVQKSLYECALAKDQSAALLAALRQTVGEGDRLMLRPVCSACREATRYQGAGGHPERREPYWII